MFELSSYLESKRKQIDAHLDNYLLCDTKPSRLTAAMRYSVMAGGKRLRPILCLAGAEAVGGRSEKALPAACALEMIHTYSLIHDDLPAMDNDDRRRGKPTCHIKFDEATAILAGDALLTLAFSILSTVENMDARHALNWLKIISRIAKAAGCAGMIEGQMRDIEAENIALEQPDLEKLHGLKTGALIQASIYCGALLGGGGQRQLDKLEAYGHCIGLAFQVIDDVLNVEGDPSVMGKSVGTDEIRNKSTYPSIMGLEASKSFARSLIDSALQLLEAFDHRADPLRAIAEYIINRKR